MPFGVLLDLFIQKHGYDAYMNPLYPTRDKIIPYWWFDFLTRAQRHTAAFDRINLSRAVLIGTAPFHVNEEGKREIDQLTTQEFTEAFASDDRDT